MTQDSLNKTSHETDDQVDFFHIIFTAWSYKKNILISSIFSILLGIAIYIFIYPHKTIYQVSIDYLGPSSSFIAKINNLPLPLQFTNMEYISKEIILDEFREVFNSYEILTQLKSEEMSKDILKLNQLERNNVIIGEVRKFSINNSNINFNSSNLSDDMQFIDLAVKKMILITGDNIQNQLKNTFENIINKLDRTIEEKKIEMEATVDKYKYELENRILFLHEQLEIANNVGIVENQTGLLLQDSRAEDAQLQMYFNDNSLPYYLRGAKFIQEELRILKERRSGKEYIKEMPVLKSQLDTLTQQKAAMNRAVEDIINNLPIKSPELIRYDINKSKIAKNKNKRQFIPLITLVVGVFIHILVIIFRDKYNKFQQMKN